ncbi:tripartite motif-containing protein 16-like isoform X2 [Megalobrama amblycephala]|uniref:tripartite motif-containing protein 16-like isoform X2 n=1 Tax=Megalobrama amblycephala TaxID=75352 RepID=UPI00201439F8|nr:tripartite motif-containing protein 16-like isoform X2 [Megalobrama amblycephala]
MKFRVAVLLLLYKCLVFAPNVIFATESAVSGLTCPLKTCTDVLKELGATEKQLKDLEIRHAKSEDQIEEIKKEKQDLEIRLAKSEAQIEEIKQDLEIRLAKSEDQIEEIKKEKQDLEIRLAKCEAQTEEIKKEKQDFVPKTRNDFLQYSRQLTLDLNTVHKRLHLSEGNTLITYTYPELQSYPDHPDRFDGVYPQVLCRESVSDQRSYWEIEWSGEHVFIAVAYKSIRRKGTGNEFGANDQSWTLSCSSSSCIFIHNNIEIVLPVKPIISRTVVNVDRYRTGVYVDHSAGTLSFYSISGDTMTLFHTVQTTFTQPLYPGFRVLYSGSSVKLI